MNYTFPQVLPPETVLGVDCLAITLCPVDVFLAHQLHIPSFCVSGYDFLTAASLLFFNDFFFGCISRHV